MKTALAVIAVLIVPLSRPPLVRSQTNRVLIAELPFGHDSAGTPTVELRKETVYWAEVVGRGTPLLKAIRSGREAFLVPVDDGREPPRFQIYPLESGLEAVTLLDQDSVGTAILRVYRDVAETERVRKVQDDGCTWICLCRRSSHRVSTRLTRRAASERRKQLRGMSPHAIG